MELKLHEDTDWVVICREYIPRARLPGWASYDAHREFFRLTGKRVEPPHSDAVPARWRAPDYAPQALRLGAELLFDLDPLREEGIERGTARMRYPYVRFADAIETKHREVVFSACRLVGLRKSDFWGTDSLVWHFAEATLALPSLSGDGTFYVRAPWLAWARNWG